MDGLTDEQRRDKVFVHAKNMTLIYYYYSFFFDKKSVGKDKNRLRIIEKRRFLQKEGLTMFYVDIIKC